VRNFTQILTRLGLKRRRVDNPADAENAFARVLRADSSERAQISNAQYEIGPHGNDIARSRASHYPC
jgi:hypothetical protein